MVLASHRFFATDLLRHHGRTHTRRERAAEIVRIRKRAVAFPPSDRSELTPKAKARSFDARAAIKPQKAVVVGRAPRGGNADAARTR